MEALQIIGYTFVFLFAAYHILPPVLEGLFWTLKGATSILKTWPGFLLSDPLISFGLVLLAYYWPYYALAVFVFFAAVIGGWGNTETKS